MYFPVSRSLVYITPFASYLFWQDKCSKYSKINMKIIFTHGSVGHNNQRSSDLGFSFINKINK